MNKYLTYYPIILLLLLCLCSKQTIPYINASPIVNEICNNGIDDDQDGLIDCYDPDCCGVPFCEAVYYDPCSIHCQEVSSPQPMHIDLEWVSAGNNWHPYNTPIVGDLDGDGEAEIVGNKGHWQGLIDYKNILVLNGQDGSVEKEITTPWFRHTGGELAIADADQNGYGEIYFKVDQPNDPFIQNKMVCYEYNGSDYPLKWISVETASGITPALADFNYDGVPELYIGKTIFNSLTGELLVQGTSEMNTGKGMSIAVDILPDDFCTDCNGLELVVGNEVYAVNIDGNTPNIFTLQNRISGSTIADGFTSIADMDLDGDLDAVVSSPDGEAWTSLYIWDVQSTQLLAFYTFEATTDGWSSIPCIRDIDQNKTPDIFISSSNSIRMLKYVGENLKEEWLVETNDWSSRSGCTIFDLNDDGFFEILHRDQTTFRILDAQTGNLLFSDKCMSTNLYEYPVIVDVDNDDEAEILCSCESELRAYGTANAPWADTRSVWNQYNYHYVNVEDDLTIPIHEQAHHLPGSNAPLNGFLNQYANDLNDFYLAVELPTSEIIELGSSLPLNPITNSDSPLSFQWFPEMGLSCTTCPNPIASPTSNTAYTIVVTNEMGCSDTTSIAVTVLPCNGQSFAIPTAFTPDADGLNDEFKVLLVEGLDLKGSIQIYNRWGQRVFATDNLNEGWNGLYKGQVQISDYYLYQVNYFCENGEQQILQGGVVLIR